MRPIFLVEADKEELLAEFKQLLEGKLDDGKIEIRYKYEYKDQRPKAKILYTPKAWAKMKILIQDFSGEVGWHGIVDRKSDNEFLVSDIVVYKQSVTGATVTTKEEEYDAFIREFQEAHLDEMLEGRKNMLNFHGHSHVNMEVSPSSTDINDRAMKMGNQMDGFYIFTIQNKSGKMNNWIYDYDNNIMYEPGDIISDVVFDDGLLSDFLVGARRLVTENTWTKKSDTTAKKDEKKFNSWPKADDKKTAPAKPKKNDAFNDSWESENSVYLPGYYPYYNSNWEME